MIIVVFIVLLNRFYTSHEVCKWCKHINCLVSCSSIRLKAIHLLIFA
jgi:hypothetical protein